MTASTGIVAVPLAEDAIALLQRTIGGDLGVQFLTSAGSQDACIRLELDESLAPEGYTLAVHAQGVTVRASGRAGFLHAVQTLRQLVQRDGTIPGVEIEDEPRFAWRGAHLDVSRHFMPIEFVRKYIELIAAHKGNVFHFHLTDDQGWRMEISGYPRLTEVAAWRKETVVGHAREPNGYDGIPHGGFYTRQELVDVVKFADELGVTIVPEIDMPGHMQAAIAAYPELGNTGEPIDVWTSFGVSEHVLNLSPASISFMETVLTEVLSIFPSQFIHIGGDECPTTQWEQSESIAALMEAHSIPDVHGVQAWLNRHLDKFLSQRGRRMVGWDEILEGGLAPGATVMSWRGEEGGITAAKMGHDVVMTPGKWTYFDHYQHEDTESEPLAIGGMATLETVYGYEPVPPQLNEEEVGHVLGSQFQIWTEYMPGPTEVEYMAYPRGCALAEVLWSPREDRDWESFRTRMERHMGRLTAWGVGARPLDERPV